MKHLRQYIQRILLSEAAKGINDLPMGVYITIDKQPDGIVIFFSNPFGQELQIPINGIIEAYNPDETTGPCDGALVVRRAFATSGYGPFLYDLALEVAGERGLTMDRDTLSPDAFHIWKYYLERRPDVQKLTLSDCVIDPRIEKYTAGFEKNRSPLHFRYVKKSKDKIGTLKRSGRMAF